MSGRGLCDKLITRTEESYRLWFVVVCDLETSWMRRPWPIGECRGPPPKKTVRVTVSTGSRESSVQPPPRKNLGTEPRTAFSNILHHSNGCIICHSKLHHYAVVTTTSKKSQETTTNAISFKSWFIVRGIVTQTRCNIRFIKLSTKRYYSYFTRRLLKLKVSLPPYCTLHDASEVGQNRQLNYTRLSYKIKNIKRILWVVTLNGTNRTKSNSSFL